MMDLFGEMQSSDFHWVVAIFQGTGASEIIPRANEASLKTYYPFRFDVRGEPTYLCGATIYSLNSKNHLRFRYVAQHLGF